VAGTILSRTGREPATVNPGRNTRVRTRVRAQWLVLAAALTVLAGVLVAWSLTRAADRVEVVSMARPVPAGTLIQAADLTTTAIAFDTPVVGLAPATSMQSLVGRMATIDLQPGVLLSAGMWADGTELSPGERTVGAVMAAGNYPVDLAQGSSALAVATEADVAGDAAVIVRVLDVTPGEQQTVVITLAVPEADAARIARLAATDALILIGVPPATGAGDTGSAAGEAGSASESDSGNATGDTSGAAGSDEIPAIAPGAGPNAGVGATTEAVGGP
jgi:flagella basal body P-ring formation protein FlgA